MCGVCGCVCFECVVRECGDFMFVFAFVAVENLRVRDYVFC